MRIVAIFVHIAASSLATIAAADDPGGSLTLAKARELALARSPEIRAAERAVEARAGGLLQASLPRNPDASVGVEDVAGTGDFHGARRAEMTIRVDQSIELGGKRSARMSTAESVRVVTEAILHERRTELRARVAEEFYDALAAQERVSIRQDATRVAEEVHDAVRSRLRAGRLSAVEEKRAAVAVARARLAEKRAALELKAAHRSLAATWGWTGEPTFGSASGNLFERASVPPWDELVARLSAAPEIRRARAELDERMAAVRSAKTKGIPDVTIGAGIRRLEETEDHAAVFGVSMPLPLFDRNQGSVEETGALRLEAEESKAAAEARLTAELAEAYADLAATDEELGRTEEEILVDAAEALRLARAGFDEGRFSFLEILDAQRAYLEIREQHVDAAARYRRAAARIERITGEAP